MNKAKEAIRDFTSRSGHHDTSVHSTTAPSVQHETVKPSQHENVNTAIDREVHQDHYHHTVQPVHDREVLPEKHHHNLGEVKHRHHDHRDHDNTKHTLATEAAKYKDERTVHDTTHTKSHAPTVQGEHVHHHIHETVQPVVHKETVEPHVVHTTVPVHETHHNAAKHHATTTLPPVTMSDYKSQGGALGGQRDHSHQLPGEPHEHGGITGAIRNHAHDSNLNGVSHHHTNGTTSGTTLDSTRHARSDSGKALDQMESRQAGSFDSKATKPSLMDKLNPKVDANGDGKAGFMS